MIFMFGLIGVFLWCAGYVIYRSRAPERNRAYFGKCGCKSFEKHFYKCLKELHECPVCGCNTAIWKVGTIGNCARCGEEYDVTLNREPF